MQHQPTCAACRSAFTPDEADRHACRLCERKARENLLALAGPRGLFAKLMWVGSEAITPGSVKMSADRVKQSKTVAPDPVIIRILNLTGVGGVVHTLQKWVGAWYADLKFSVPVWRGNQQFVTIIAPDGSTVKRPGQLDQAVNILVNCLPWAVENRSDFRDFYVVVDRFVTDIRQALDPPEHPPVRVVIGKCPTTTDSGKKCGEALVVDPFSSAIRCGKCRSRWTRAEWLALRAQIASTS